jgi:ribosome-associated protein
MAKSTTKKSVTKKNTPNKTPKKASIKKASIKKTTAKKSGSNNKKSVKEKAVSARTLINAIKEGMLEKKALDVKWLDLTKIINGSFDHFVICHADNKIQVNAIADSIEEIVWKKTNMKPYHVEGKENGEWIILDYIDVVAHVFLGEFRFHYNLEGFWGDAKIKVLT